MEFEVSLKISLNVFQGLRSKGAQFKRNVGDKFLFHDGNGFDLVDYDDLPEELKEDSRTRQKRRKRRRKKGDQGRAERPGKRRKGSEPSPGRKSRARDFRKGVMKGESEGKVAKRAADNHYIMQDVLSDPSMVGADSETEAVAKVAAENPGWAKMSSLVDAYDIDVDVDGNVSSPGSDGDSSDSTSSTESGDSEISTADPGDLGPSGPSDYGIDAGGESGSSSGESGGDVGSSVSTGSSGTGSSGGDSGSSGLGGDAGGGDL